MPHGPQHLFSHIVWGKKMFRRSLVSEASNDALRYLSVDWVDAHPWLVRVPFFDDADPDSVYANAYSEKAQEYIVTKYHCGSGEVIWQQHVVNGGYGTPAVFGDLVVSLDGFDSVVFLDKFTGHKLKRIRYGSRVRSSINVFGGCCWLTHASHVVALDSEANTIHDFHIEDAFLYGGITQFRDLIIVSGTRFCDWDNSGHKFVWAVNASSGEQHYSVDLGKGNIISSDVSGVWLQGDRAYVTNNNVATCLDAETGCVIWSAQTPGNVHRHAVVSDGEGVYFTTLTGNFGKLNIEDGRLLWCKKAREYIVSPPAIYCGSLLVCSDASLYVCDKRNGYAYQKLPIGHVPYSAPVIWKGRVFIGGGEPPSNGAMIAFASMDRDVLESEIVECFHFDNSIESKAISVSIETRHEWEALSVDASVISKNGVAAAKMLGPRRACLHIPLKETCLPGYYALPLSCRNNFGECHTDIIVIELTRDKPLPGAVRLPRYEKPVREVDVFNSGSALIQMVHAQYGKSINQRDFRAIIDYLKERSNWEDADFQTWRLIMKRALSSPATTLDEFIALEKEAEDSFDEERVGLS